MAVVVVGDAHRKQLVSLAHPVYFGLLASVAAGIINTLWVSRLGGPAVAAVAVATNAENVRVPPAVWPLSSAGRRGLVAQFPAPLWVGQLPSLGI
ncbi:hypothetical protein [Streptomyces sp. A30]|uniref:hypothetical protein n=1 Tax=Streptomyces sp. A30 TaxID=2789273 RepID=UPI00398059C0